MARPRVCTLGLLLFVAAPTAAAAPPAHPSALFEPTAVASEGSVTVNGTAISYRAVTGTIVVHPAGYDDTAWRTRPPKDAEDPSTIPAEAAMSYTAYFKKDAPAASRPVTFLYNGGPGSATMWLHIGAFGPVRVVTSNDTHTPAAPYGVVNNANSLLDVSDLVFIDAPGTGFGRIAGKDKEKAFYGTDADAYAFAEFIKSFLGQYGRWNSPKFLFGESYGTTRSALLASLLTTGGIDLNGVILLSQILNMSINGDVPYLNPGVNEPYVVMLPSFAAAAWYHNRIAGGRPPVLETFLAEVERFADTDYLSALQQGAALDPARKRQIAEKIAAYTGLSVDYVLRSNLRMTTSQFAKELQASAGLTTGRLDARFAGPDIDPLAKEADYDPQSAAVSSAYVAAFNDYARAVLKYDKGVDYRLNNGAFRDWTFTRKIGTTQFSALITTNTLPDLAKAMKFNPGMKVLLTGGYFDFATPYYQGKFEMRQLPVPDALQANLSYRYYRSGHMVYANPESHKALHDDVAHFIVQASRG